MTYHLTRTDIINFTISAPCNTTLFPFLFSFSSITLLLRVHTFFLQSSFQIFWARSLLSRLMSTLLTSKSEWVIIGSYVFLIWCVQKLVLIRKVKYVPSRRGLISVFIVHSWSQLHKAVNTFKFKITYCQIPQISSCLCTGQFHLLGFLFIDYEVHLLPSVANANNTSIRAVKFLTITTMSSEYAQIYLDLCNISIITTPSKTMLIVICF
jgi:hypothetical protein